NGERILVQAKNYQHPVGPAAVRDLYGTMMAAGVKKGLLITTSTITDGARRFAENKNIEFLTGAQVVDLIRKHNDKFFPLKPEPSARETGPVYRPTTPLAVSIRDAN